MTAEQQRQIDNRLLEMIQRHFPSLPLADGYTDWAKWLGFARAAYDAGVADECKACAMVVRAERLTEPVSTEEDRAYNLALEHAEGAIQLRSNDRLTGSGEGE